jgi:hypothetical protein
MKIGLTAGVTGQQGMLTPPWHLIPSLIYSEVRICPFSDLYFLWDLWDWLLFVIFVLSSGKRNYPSPNSVFPYQTAVEVSVSRSGNGTIYRHNQCVQVIDPVRIRIRIDPPHPLVCRKRRLNLAVLRMRPEKPKSRVTAGVARWRSLPAQRLWAPSIGLNFAALQVK